MEGLFSLLQKIIEQGWEYIKFWQVITQYEGGVLLRLGKPLDPEKPWWNFWRGNSVLEPGLHWKLPIFDYVYTAITSVDTMEIKAVNITTLDGKTSTNGLVIKFDITDVYSYLVLTNEPRSNMHDVCRGILSDYLEDCNWEDIRKKPTINAIRKKIEKECDEMGIRVLSVNFSDKCLTRAIKLFSDGMII